MKILALNTALPLTEVVLLHGDEVLLSESWPSNYDEAEKLLPVIKELLPDLQGLDKILLVSGPGAFTGLRVGVTVANTLAFTYSVPIISCSTFEYLEQKIPDKLAAASAVILRAGSGVAVRLPGDGTIHRMKKDEIALPATVKYVVSDVRDEARDQYALPKGIDWLDLRNLNSFADAARALLAGEHPEHKLVKPQYPAPPHITKSKKQVFAP